MPELHRFRTPDGRTLGYLSEGDGPPLVMVPGGPGFDPEAYYAGVEVEDRRRLVVCPRGTGGSSPPEHADGYRLAGFVDDVAALLAELRLERVEIYGHSYGATVALGFAVRHPDQVSALVLESCPTGADLGDFVPAARDRFATTPEGAARLEAADRAGGSIEVAQDEQAVRRGLRGMLDRYVVDPSAPVRGYLNRLCDAPLNFDADEAAYGELFGGLDLRAQASDLSVRTLVIGGRYDTTVPIEHSRTLAEALPSSNLAELECGHFPMIELPGAWRDRVDAFLGGPAESARG